eukprot:tig00020693_g13012.t1
MALLTFFGCLFVALGPAFAIFLTIITKKSYLPVVMIGSSFFWLFSVLLASIFWYIVPPIQSTWGFIVVYSAILQEILRYGYFRLYIAAERGFSKMAGSTAALTDGLMSAIASGLGWGVIYVLVMYVGLLFNATGPGDLYMESCPRISFFLASAFQAGCHLLLHVFYMVAAFDGYFRRSFVQPIVVTVLHIGASLISLANRNSEGCHVSLPLIFALTAGAGAYTSVLVHRRKPMPPPSAHGRRRGRASPTPPEPPVVDHHEAAAAPAPAPAPAAAATSAQLTALGASAGSSHAPSGPGTPVHAGGHLPPISHHHSAAPGGSSHLSAPIPGTISHWVDDGGGPSLVQAPPSPGARLRHSQA